MFITKSQNAKAYEAPGHHNMQMHRIQGKDASPLNGVWCAKLTLEPGGYVEASTSHAAKLYIVDSGTVEFTGGVTTVQITKGDSVFVLPGESRAFKDINQSTAVLYLVMLEDYQHS